MADTRRAMHVLEGSRTDAELVRALLVAEQGEEAAQAFARLRECVGDDELLLLANLREVLAEMPTPPFRTGERLELLSRAGGYEDTGRSYRRLFGTDSGVFGVEFVGRGHECAQIEVHTPQARLPVRNEAGELEPAMLDLFVRHAVLLDALLEALAFLGLPMEPTIYLSIEDFLADHASVSGADANT